MGQDLVRFSVTMPQDLLDSLDDYTAHRGMSKNRSEAVRDLVREALVDATVADPDAFIFGTLTMVFDHHANDLRDKLDSIQHAHCDEIVSTMHVHVDPHNCMEVIIMKGRSATVSEIADALLGTKGVLHGKLVTTAIASDAHAHSHEHSHENGHAHHHEHPHTH